MFNNTGGDIYEMCGPQYAFAVWVSARLIFVNAVNTHVDIPPELDYLVGLLTKMGSRWEGSLRYANILKFLKDEALLAKKNGSSFYGRTKNLQANVDTYNDTDNDDLNEDVKDHSKNVRIISDMRLNAYSLDVLLYNKIENSNKMKMKLRQRVTKMILWICSNGLSFQKQILEIILIL